MSSKDSFHVGQVLPMPWAPGQSCQLWTSLSIRVTAALPKWLPSCLTEVSFKSRYRWFPAIWVEQVQAYIQALNQQSLSEPGITKTGFQQSQGELTNIGAFSSFADWSLKHSDRETEFQFLTWYSGNCKGDKWNSIIQNAVEYIQLWLQRKVREEEFSWLDFWARNNSY